MCKPLNISMLCSYTLRYPNELRSQSDYFRDIQEQQINEDSLTLAEALIAKRSSPFDLSKFEDGYEVAVRELVNAKLNHLPIPTDEVVQPGRGKVANLMDALRKSIGSSKSTSAKVPKKPAASAKPETEKGLGLVKTATNTAGRRKSA
jgi:DNA end-binding protein Ku